jgi:hypothetical protein
MLEQLRAHMEHILINVLPTIDKWYEWEYFGGAVRAPGDPATGGGGHTL